MVMSTSTFRTESTNPEKLEAFVQRHLEQQEPCADAQTLRKVGQMLEAIHVKAKPITTDLPWFLDVGKIELLDSSNPKGAITLSAVRDQHRLQPLFKSIYAKASLMGLPIARNLNDDADRSIKDVIFSGGMDDLTKVAEALQADLGASRDTAAASR